MSKFQAYSWKGSESHFKFHIYYFQKGEVGKGEEELEASDGLLAQGVHVKSITGGGLKLDVPDIPLEVVLESFYFNFSSTFSSDYYYQSWSNSISFSQSFLSIIDLSI